MRKIKRLFFYLCHPKEFIKRNHIISLVKNSKSFEDEEYLKQLYKIVFDRDLDLKNPKTFNEKLNWLKIHNRKPLFTMMVDKYESKKIFDKLIGPGHTAKTYGIFNSFDDIDFNNLPNQFVIKTTHDCGGTVICKDKKSLNMKQARLFINKHLQDNYYFHCREWPYKNVKPRIIVEEYLFDKNNTILPVYKFFCFNGNPYLIQAIQNDKTPKETIDYFDCEWNRLLLRQNFKNSKKTLPKPTNLDLMLSYSKTLSKDIPFLRVDFYSVNGKIYFSEFTFFSDAGFTPFHPSEWDIKLGDLIDLKLVNNQCFE